MYDYDFTDFERPEREYYFPDEKRFGKKILEFVNKFLTLTILDTLPFFILFPIIFVLMKYFGFPFLLNGTETIWLMKLGFAYILVCTLIGIILGMFTNRFVYVKEGYSLYKVRISTLVNLNPRINGRNIVSKEEIQRDANRLIHTQYQDYISYIDRLIGDNNSKTVTCTPYDGSVTIPRSYFRYDPNESYYSKGGFGKVLFLVLKLSIYVAALFLIIQKGRINYMIRENALNGYIDSKVEILTPLGYELNRNFYNYPDSLHFDRTVSDSSDHIKITYKNPDYPVFCDDTVSLYVDMKYDEDIYPVYNLALVSYDGEMIDIEFIEELLEEYRTGNKDDISEMFNTKDGYVHVLISESENNDYHLAIICCRMYSKGN